MFRKICAFSVADWTTASRIGLTVPITMAIYFGFNTIALACYLLAPVSDLLDGYLARRGRGGLGPGFDGMADAVFGGFLIGWGYWKLPQQRPLMEVYLFLFFGVALFYALVCWRLTGRILLLHLWTGKLMGWTAFLWFGLAFFGGAGSWTVHLAGSVAICFYVESLAYILRGRRDPDGRSAFF